MTQKNLSQEQLDTLKSIYYDFVYVRAYHYDSKLAKRMLEIDEKFEKLLMDLVKTNINLDYEARHTTITA